MLDEYLQNQISWPHGGSLVDVSSDIGRAAQHITDGRGKNIVVCDGDPLPQSEFHFFEYGYMYTVYTNTIHIYIYIYIHYV